MKKIITNIIIAITAITMVGCSQMKEWFNSPSFETVVAVISPALKTAATTTVYAVTKKNPDLKNIFIAAGNGIKIAINSSDYSTEQIENYIKQGLGKDVNTWYPLIKTSMDTILSWYNAIYEKYFDIKDEKCIQGFNTLLASLADGVINGASMNTQIVAESTYVMAKSKEVIAVEELRVKCAEFGIEIE